MEDNDGVVIPEETGEETTVIEKTADERIAEAVATEKEAARAALEEKDRQLTQAQQRASAAERAASAAQVKREEEAPVGNLGELLTTDPEKAAKLIQAQLERSQREAREARVQGMAMAAERKFDDLYPDLKSPMDKKIAAQLFMETDPTLSVDERVRIAGDEVRKYVNAKTQNTTKAKEGKNKEIHKAQVVTGAGDKPAVVVEKEETTDDYIKARQERLEKTRGII